MNIIGEKNPTEPIDAGQPIDRKLCPTMSQMLPMQSSLSGEIEMVMQAAPCTGKECGRWLDGDCADVVIALALQAIARRLDDQLDVNTKAC